MTATPTSSATSNRSALTRSDRVSLAVLVVVATLTTLLFAAQPVLAGQLLTGDRVARATHGTVGTEILGAMTLLQTIAALAAFRRRPGRRVPLILAALLFAALFVQIGAGYGGQVALHVPLGVAMVGVQVWLTTHILRTWRHPG